MCTVRRHLLIAAMAAGILFGLLLGGASAQDNSIVVVKSVEGQVSLLAAGVPRAVEV